MVGCCEHGDEPAAGCINWGSRLLLASQDGRSCMKFVTLSLSLIISESSRVGDR